LYVLNEKLNIELEQFDGCDPALAAVGLEITDT
jgi:hypothetical protein